MVDSVLDTASFLACLIVSVAVGHTCLQLHNLFTSGGSRKKENEIDLEFPVQEPQPPLARVAWSYHLGLVAFEIQPFLEFMKAEGSAQSLLLAGW